MLVVSYFQIVFLNVFLGKSEFIFNICNQEGGRNVIVYDFSCILSIHSSFQLKVLRIPTY